MKTSMSSRLAGLSLVVSALVSGIPAALAAEEVDVTPRREQERSVAPDDEGGNGLADILKNVHGEVGVTVGSDGTRAAYGTAAIPLGERAGAIVSFSAGRYGESYYTDRYDRYCERYDPIGRCLDGPDGFWRSRTMPVPPGR